VTGVGGVFLRAKDPAALASWYRDHLGVPVEENGAFAVFRWSESGGSTVWALFPEETDYFGPSGQGGMVNFRVADLDRVLADLRSEGVEVLERVEEHEFGRFGWVVDPEGHRVELWQPPEGA
jgi:catechol 2,3-dioxygenase-like lactoylglutathione lyase family enzyme